MKLTDNKIIGRKVTESLPKFDREAIVTAIKNRHSNNFVDLLNKIAGDGTQPEGTAKHPLEDRHSPLSSEEIEGTGKIGISNVPSLPPELAAKYKVLQENDPDIKINAYQEDGKWIVTTIGWDGRTNTEQWFNHEGAWFPVQEEFKGASMKQAQMPMPPPPGAPGDQAPESDVPVAPEVEPSDPVEQKKPLDEVLPELATSLDKAKELAEEVQSRIEEGETILHGQDVVPVEGGEIGGEKVAVDDAAKKYYHDFYGEYGDKMTKDRIASTPKFIRVANTIKFIKDVWPNLGLDKAVKIASHVSDFDYTQMSNMFKKLNDATLLNISDKVVASYLVESEDAINQDKSIVLKAAINKNATVRDNIFKYVEAVGMKSPSLSKKHTDAVDVTKLEDMADDEDSQLARPAHLPMEVTHKELKGSYVFLYVEWDPKHAAADRSQSGIDQAVRSFVKGLESQKEFKDLGFLGQVNIEKLDPKDGLAIVYFRTKKPADSPMEVIVDKGGDK